MQVVGNYNGSTKQYEAVKGRQIHWGGGRTAPPPDVPECGFDGSKCPEDRKSSTTFCNSIGIYLRQTAVAVPTVNPSVDEI